MRTGNDVSLSTACKRIDNLKSNFNRRFRDENCEKLDDDKICIRCLSDIDRMTEKEEAKVQCQIKGYMDFIQNKNSPNSNADKEPNDWNKKIHTNANRIQNKITNDCEINELLEEINNLEFQISQEQEIQEIDISLLEACVNELESMDNSSTPYSLSIDHKSSTIFINGLRLRFELSEESEISFKEVNSAWVCLSSYLLFLRQSKGLIPSESVSVPGKIGEIVTILPMTNRVILMQRARDHSDYCRTLVLQACSRSDDHFHRYEAAVLLLAQTVSLSLEACGGKGIQHPSEHRDWDR